MAALRKARGDRNSHQVPDVTKASQLLRRVPCWSRPRSWRCAPSRQPGSASVPRLSSDQRAPCPTRPSRRSSFRRSCFVRVSLVLSFLGRSENKKREDMPAIRERHAHTLLGYSKKMRHQISGGHVLFSPCWYHTVLTQVSVGACGRSNGAAALRPPWFADAKSSAICRHL